MYMTLMMVRWSTDNEEVIELDPHYKDYSLYCGTQLDIRASSTTNITAIVLEISDHGLINYIDTKAKCCHLTKLT
jgi:hypothetical protein